MATAQLSDLRHPPSAIAQQPDQIVDMFSARGFELAQRIAKAFSCSDAVPAQFRSMVEKKGRNGSTWVENPSAMGNCIVAIETARAVGMSITAVMQNANVIEGRLSWSAQFVIAAINASGRFTPLRFQMRDGGRIKAKYREKQGWNDQKRGYDYLEKVVEVDNIECVAWALPRNVPIPPNVYTLDQAKAAGLPVIEGAPVSMQLAVEEGWYSKSGSKWQTGMKTLMLQYRAGTFFGRIHAPDIVMGMGRTTEEIIDVAAIEIPTGGASASESMRRAAATLQEVRETRRAEDLAEELAEDDREGGKNSEGAGAPWPTFNLDAFIARIEACTDLALLQVLNDETQHIPEGPDLDAVLTALEKRDAELAAAGAVGGAPTQATPRQPAPAPVPPSATPARRARPTDLSAD